MPLAKTASSGIASPKSVLNALTPCPMRPSSLPMYHSRPDTLEKSTIPHRLGVAPGMVGVYRYVRPSSRLAKTPAASASANTSLCSGIQGCTHRHRRTPFSRRRGGFLAGVRKACLFPPMAVDNAPPSHVGAGGRDARGASRPPWRATTGPDLVPAGGTPLGLAVPERPARWHRRSGGQLRIAGDDVRDPRAVNQEEVQAIVLSLDLGRDRRRGTAAEVPGDPEGGV